jgi:hypothetical protein
VPIARYFVLYEAWLPARVTVAIVVPPSWNTTVPVAVPPYWLATVAVYVTTSLITAGFCEDAREVVVIAAFTPWVNDADALELNFCDPWYTAVIEREPAPSNDVETDALPFANVALPSAVEPSKNTTIPVGVPAADFTLAVNVTTCPKIDGLSDEAKVVVVSLDPT